MNKTEGDLPGLNQTEETVMQAVWAAKQGFVGDIMQHIPEPKLPYNTVVTAIRNLEKKGYVQHETFVNANRYTPAVDRKTFVNRSIASLVKNYFNSSYNAMLSFFVEDKMVSREELEQALDLIKQQEGKKEGKE